jgi:hypothetical protein
MIVTRRPDLFLRRDRSLPPRPHATVCPITNRSTRPNDVGKRIPQLTSTNSWTAENLFKMHAISSRLTVDAPGEERRPTIPEFCVAYEGCECVAGDEGLNEVLLADKSKVKDDGSNGYVISLRSIVAYLSFRHLSSCYTSPHHLLTCPHNSEGQKFPSNFSLTD